jgi:hypothetical protein
VVVAPMLKQKSRPSQVSCYPFQVPSHGPHTLSRVPSPNHVLHNDSVGF